MRGEFSIWKEVKVMKRIFLDELTTEHQFISFCKTVLRNEASNIRAEEKRWNNKFILLSELDEGGINELCICTYDFYEAESIIFHTHEYSIFIYDLLIAEAIAHLPNKRQQDVILLTFFLDLKDREVAKIINIAPSTLYYHKIKALAVLREFILRRQG